jgi:REP element-mobilizing transposase RayT
MPQSLSNVLIHAVWSTKERVSFLTDKPLREEMHCYLGGISARLDCPTMIVGGVADHVHILMRLARTITLADWVKEMKRASTVWLIEQAGRDPMLSKFHWQAGYGTFSVSESKAEEVRAYIAKQDEHHRKITFQDEYRRFLKAHGIEWDERYVWD